MKQKTTLRSIRVREDIDELINQQIGDTYTEKITNLITRCVWELPAKETELARVEKQIKERKKELNELYRSAQSWRATMQGINTRLMSLETILDRELDTRKT